MPIAVTCRCGKSFRAKDELAGKKVLCPTCKGVLTILLPAPPPTPPAPTRSAEDEALAVLMSDEPVREEKPIRRTPVDPVLPPLSANAPVESFGMAQISETKVPRSSNTLSGGETKAATKPKKPVKPRPDLYSTSSSRGFFADANWGGALVGLLMMLGGAAWLGLGLMANTFFPYSIVVIALGFMGMVKSILGFSTNDD
jgi:hypothetical protein